jgi:hypothetical protein
MAAGEVRMPDTTSLPPRNALPRDVEIPVLPGLGLTWYDRGGAYWARRAALAFMWALVLLLIVLMDVGIFGAIRHSLALFLMSLMPQPLPERQARLWMAERLRERGPGTPAG